jgi:hypothetical protein
MAQKPGNVNRRQAQSIKALCLTAMEDVFKEQLP